MNNKIPYNHVLSDKEAERLVYDEMLRKGASIIDEFQEKIHWPKEETVEKHFMAHTGKYEAREHIANAKKLTFFDSENDTEMVIIFADIFRICYPEDEEPKVIHEHSYCFKATFHNLMGYGSELDARCYFGSEEWLNDYVIKPFQEKREMYWDKYKA